MSAYPRTRRGAIDSRARARGRGLWYHLPVITMFHKYRFEFHLVTATAAIALLCACPVLKRGGDDATGSGTAASGNGSGEPSDQTGESAKKLEIPRKVLRLMDFPADFTLVEVNDGRDAAHIVYTVNPPRTAEIAQMHISDLNTRGYTTDDNASRILEGVEFKGGECKSIYVRVTEEASRGTVVTIDLTY